MWAVVLVDEVADWYLSLSVDTNAVTAAIDRLAVEGPMLGRPTVDRIQASRLHNLKELRPAATSVRILFVFDPTRQAVLLVAGDKAGNWRQWYEKNIPLAEQRYQRWLDGGYDDER